MPLPPQVLIACEGWPPSLTQAQLLSPQECLSLLGQQPAFMGSLYWSMLVLHLMFAPEGLTPLIIGTTAIKQSTQCKAKYYQLRANLYQSLEHANQLMPMLQHDYHTKKIQLVRYLAFFVINQKV